MKQKIQLDRAEEILRKQLPKNHPEIVRLAMARSGYFTAKGDFIGQNRLAKTTFERTTKAFGPNDNLTLLAKTDLSTSLYRLGQYEKSENLSRQVHKHYVSVGKADDPAVISSALNLVWDLVALGRLAEAEALFADNKKLIDVSDKGHEFLLAKAYRADAVIRETKMDYDGAKNSLDQAYKIYSDEKYKLAGSGKGGPNPNFEALTANRIALDLHRLRLKKFPFYGFIPKEWNEKWANIKIGEKRHFKAEVDLKEPVPITNWITAKVMENAARSKERSWNVEKVQPFYQSLIDWNTKSSGPASPNTAKAIQDLGKNLLKQNNPFEAEVELSKSLTMQIAALPPDHPDIALSHAMIGQALEMQGRFDEALGRYSIAIGSFEAHPNTNNLALLDSIIAKDRLLLAMGKHQERGAHWQVWENRFAKIKLFNSSAALEKLTAALRSYSRYMLSKQGCPPKSFQKAYRDMADNLLMKPEKNGTPFVIPGFVRSRLTLIEALGELVACDGNDEENICLL